MARGVTRRRSTFHSMSVSACIIGNQILRGQAVRVTVKSPPLGWFVFCIIIGSLGSFSFLFHLVGNAHSVASLDSSTRQHSTNRTIWHSDVASSGMWRHRGWSQQDTRGTTRAHQRMPRMAPRRHARQKSIQRLMTLNMVAEHAAGDTMKT